MKKKYQDSDGIHIFEQICMHKNNSQPMGELHTRQASMPAPPRMEEVNLAHGSDHGTQGKLAQSLYVLNNLRFNGLGIEFGASTV